MAYALDGGRLAELRCLQWSGEPMHDTNGVAITRYERDASGFLRAESHFGVDGKPIVSTRGVHRAQIERDVAGRETVRVFFGVDGAPVASTKGCHRWSLAYDEHGDLVRSTCIGATGQPVLDAAGVATTVTTFDDRGCERTVRALGVDDAPVATETGVHGRDFARDAACRVTSRTCVGVDDARVPCGPGQPAQFSYTYDSYGRVTETRHYGVDKRPAGDPRYGVYLLRSGWDERDREVWGACFDAAERHVECSRTGFHARVVSYDDVGREIASRFADVDGAPATNLGTAVLRSRYDNYDHVYEESSLDGTGTTHEVHGMSSQRYLYDAKHRLFGSLLLDKAGNPARYTGCFTGLDCPDTAWHAVRIVRRADGVAIANVFFDAAGQRLVEHACAKKRCFE